MSEKSRTFCFSKLEWNNKFLEKVKSLNYSYIIIGEETSTETNKKILLGYIRFKKQRRLKNLKKLDKSWNLLISSANDEQNKSQCTKESILFEDGGIIKLEKVNQIALAKAIIDETNSLTRVTEQVDSLEAVNFAKEYLRNHEYQRNFKPEIIWIFGDEGIGKTNWAIKYCNEKYGYYWMSCESLEIWDGYDAHPAVIIDDLTLETCDFNLLLRIFDQHSCRIRTDIGMRQLLAKTIIVTSLKRPEDVFELDDVSRLLRRIDKVISL